MAARQPTGIRVRHGRGCATTIEAKRAKDENREPQARRCTCRPTYEAWISIKAPPGDRRTHTKTRRTFSNLAEAKSWRGDADSQARRGTFTAPTKETLREAAQAWLELAEQGVILCKHRRPYKPATLRAYRADLERYVLDDLGARKLTEITPDDLQALVERLSAGGLSGSKVRNVIVPLQAIYRRHRRKVMVDPTRDLDLPEPAGAREWTGTPDDARALLEPLDEDDVAVWATAFLAGLRRGELRALRVDNLHGLDDPEAEAWIDVEHGWDDVEGEIAPKSTAGVRKALMPESLRVLLADHVRRTGRTGNDLAFGRTASTPFSPALLRRRALKAWAAAAVGAFLRGESIALEPVTLHECRHGHGSFLDAAGISEARADRAMGHSSTSVGDRYRHQLRGQLRDDAARLEAYLAGEAAPVVTLGARRGAQAA